MKYNVTLKSTVEAETANSAEQMVLDKAAGDVDVTAGGTGMNHSLYEVKDNECGHDYVVCEGVVRIIGDGEINCPVCKTPTDCKRTIGNHESERTIRAESSRIFLY